MWKKKWTVHKNNPRMYSLQQNKKAVLTTTAYFSVYSRKVAWTIIALRLPLFTRNGVSGIKQKSDFLDEICPKRVFSVQSRKSEQHHWILHIRISLGTKFQLKVTILIFWTKFSRKVCFRSKTGRVNTTIEFCIFE